MSINTVSASQASEFITSQLNAPNIEKAHFIPAKDFPNYLRSQYAAQGVLVSDAYIDYQINFPINNPQGGASLLPEEWEAQYGAKAQSSTKVTLSQAINSLGKHETTHSVLGSEVKDFTSVASLMKSKLASVYVFDLVIK